MNKNHWMWVGVIVVVVLGWCFYITNSGNYSYISEVKGKIMTHSKKNVTTSGSDKTAQSIFNQPGSHLCENEQVNNIAKNTSSIYIADGKMRGEFRSVTVSKTSTNLLVYSDGMLYAWEEGRANGTKTKIGTVAELPALIPKDLVSSPVFGNGTYNFGWYCHDWNKKDSSLTPPSYVKFN
jgi:hypothetical protein